MDFTFLLDQIPEYTHFYTVQKHNERSFELQNKYPHLVTVREAGKSRNNESIYVLEIGKGKKNALLIGCPHPNEPIGAMMLDFFTEALVSNPVLLEYFDFTWYCIKIIDVDGTKLNEGWFDKEPSVENYASNFFRPAYQSQVEWTFPCTYKNLLFNNPLPETKILMDLIDGKKPEFIYSLHNCGFGGVYYYLTNGNHELFDKLKQLPGYFNIPLALGEPEVPFMEKWTDALYKFYTKEMEINYIESISGPVLSLNSGKSSAEYASNSFSFVCELPYFYCKQIQDTSESQFTLKELRTTSQKIKKEIIDFYNDLISEKECLELITNHSSVFFDGFIDALKHFSRPEETIVLLKTDNRYATKAEEFDNLTTVRFFQILYIGMLQRHIREILYIHPQSHPGIHALEKTQNFFHLLLQKLDQSLQYEVIPIKTLISIQLLAGLIVAEFVQKSTNQDKDE